MGAFLLFCVDFGRITLSKIQAAFVDKVDNPKLFLQSFPYI